MLDYIRKRFGPKKHTTAVATVGQAPEGAPATSAPHHPASSPSDKPRVFLSYSRTDAAFAAVVRRLIQDRRLRLWQDIPDVVDALRMQHPGVGDWGQTLRV